MSMNKDALLNAVLAASGGKQVIKYNQNGDPCFFTRIPCFNLEDINPILGNGPHPAFVVNGVVKSEILIGTYEAIVEKNCAISIPGQSPKASVNFDQAKTYCLNNGAGFHLMTAWERAAIVLWCLKNGFQPRGNDTSGKSREAGWETGTPAPDNALKILVGSGHATWRHDGTMAGISDLVGNINEWIDGLKSIDGRLYFPLDNNYLLAEGNWPASSIYLDATNNDAGDRDGAADSGDIVLSDRITKYSEIPTPAGGGDPGDFDYALNHGETGWRNTALAGTYANISLDMRQKAAQLMIAPKVAAADEIIFPLAKGAFYSRNYGERLPFWGGNWSSGTYAGLAYLFLYYRRSNVNSSLGFRPAYIL